MSGSSLRRYPASGARAAGDRVPASGTPVLFVLAHGAGAGHDHPFMTSYARDLATAGVDVVTFNFPYMRDGRRIPDRAPVLEACFRDIVAEAQALPGLAAHRLVVGGKSMGGRMATHLAAQGLEGLCGVVVFGYPLHPPGKPEQLRVQHLPQIAVPFLIVQGERDAFGSPNELAPHVATVPGGVTMHVVERGDHSLVVRGEKPEVVRASVVATMTEWMSGLG